MLKQLVLAMFIGVMGIIYIAQSDPLIKQSIITYFRRELQQSLACHISCNLEEISLVSASMRLTRVQVSSVEDAAWSWSADQLFISYSWWQFLLYGSFDFSVIADNPQVQSIIIDNKLAINEHLDLAFKGPSVHAYTFLREATCNHMRCTIIDPCKKVSVYFVLDMQAKKIDRVFKSAIDIYEGALVMQNRTLFTDMSGSLFLDSFDGQPTVDICLKGAASFEIPQLGNQTTPCYISGSWHHKRGMLSIKNIDHSFAIDPIVIQAEDHMTEVLIDAKVPISYLWRIATNNDDDRISGSCTLQAKMSIDDVDYAAQGHLILQRICWRDMEIGSLGKINFNKKNESIAGNVYIQRTSGACAGGEWSWSLKSNTAQAFMKNNARLTLSPKHDWQILPDDLLIELKTDGLLTQVTYDAKATHAKVNNHITSKGNLSIDERKVEIEGLFDNNRYECTVTYDPEWSLEYGLLSRSDNTPLVHIVSHDERYTGMVTVACIKDLLKKKYDFDLQGEGVFELFVEPGNTYQVGMHLKDGTIRLPHTFNFMNGLDCTIAIDKDLKQCTITDVACQLHNGSLRSKKMRLELSDDFTPRFVYAPLLIDRCFINMGKELFAVISGNLILSKRFDAGASLQGHILIDRSQLKENLFSDIFQRKLRSYTARSFKTEDDDLLCDVTVKTKYPVRIQTPFLETDARIDLHIKNKVREPHVIGAIHLHSGKIYFPYKALYITKGILHFVPGHLDDPMIELAAKNSIKKNDISLHVTGTLQDQHIRLESSPTLTEEQIISLLLVGSQEESLNIVMPALIMQNIKSILFGHDQSATNMSRYFNALLKPFGRIHLVPSFIDQSGRGGLRGAVEIELNERWRVVIQKNFSLTEDTRFELEYLLSDDMSIRATRDIRRDLIGEVEMRYKFGNN